MYYKERQDWQDAIEINRKREFIGMKGKGILCA